ncbi:MAG: DNA polymerase III subunit delta [Actinobacteria bacterium]|nr:DNA polymerase III subunit delta [Actinomycetota bacterium]
MSPERIESIEKLKSVYLLYGDEELLMEEALKRLRELLSSEVDPDFNIEVLDASEVGVEHVIDSAETVPLMSPRRLVIAKEVDKLSRKEQVRLAEYIGSPNPATVLVLVAHFRRPGEQRDTGNIRRIEGTELFRKTRDVGDTLKFTFGQRGKQQKIESWVKEEFKKRGKKITGQAENMLLERAGRELRDLEDAVERICLYSEDNALVTEKEVEEVVAASAEQGIFDFVDAVADRRRDLSLYLFNRIVRQGESPMRVFNILLRQFRLIARVKSLATNHDYQQMASRLGVPPFLVRKCVQQAKRFSSGRLRSTFQEFRHAQVELHSSNYMNESEYQSAVLETLITRIIG